MGEPAVILGIQKQPGANTLQLTRVLDSTLDDMQRTLPPGMKVDKHLFRQADFIEVAVNNVVTALRDGGILGILSDVNAHPKEGVFVPFFGVTACTTSGAATLAIHANAFIYPTFCVWDRAAKRYKIVHGALLEPVITGDRKRDIVETTALYTAEIEKIIRAYPDQWMWIHRRWKTRPPGEPKIYGKDN